MSITFIVATINWFSYFPLHTATRRSNQAAMTSAKSSLASVSAHCSASRVAVSEPMAAAARSLVRIARRASGGVELTRRPELAVAG